MSRLLAFCLLCIVWGLTWLPLKVASAEVPPILLAAVRFSAAGCCLVAWCLATGLPLRTSQPGRLVAASLLITTGAYALLFWGVAHAPSGLSAIVNLSLIPVFTILIGRIYGEEVITGRRVVAIAVGAVGLVILFLGRTSTAGSSLGLAAIALATASYTWGAILSRSLGREMPPVALACWETLIGGLALTPVSLILERPAWSDVLALTHPTPLLSLAFLVIGGSLTGFTIYLWLVRDWGAFRAGLYAFVSPIVAVIAGTIWLGEPFGAPEAVGMVLMLGATALVIGRPARQASA